MPDDNLKKNIKRSLIAMIENSVGSRAYNNFYVKNKESGLEYDVLNDGELSCAFFVSSILTIFKLIDKPHTTIKTTEEKLIEAGWKETEERKPGVVILWEPIRFDDGSVNEHIGFALNEDEAVSTSIFKHEVARHDIGFRTKSGQSSERKIMKLYENNNI